MSGLVPYSCNQVARQDHCDTTDYNQPNSTHPAYIFGDLFLRPAIDRVNIICSTTKCMVVTGFSEINKIFERIMNTSSEASFSEIDTSERI